MPDVLVGRLPVVTRDGRRLRAEYIELPPPQPFNETDVTLMWETVKASSVPLLSGISAQGRLDLADPSALRAEELEPEFLPAAHSAARALVAKWPQLESVQHVWRPLDVTAGREDERNTEKRAGIFPAITRQDGTRRPTSTSRIVPTGHLWRSNLLAAMAHEVLGRIDRVEADRVPSLAAPKLIKPFEAVARQARDHSGALERPLSTWPARATAAATAFGALLSGVAPTDGGRTFAPLCYLWRLYEAWVAVQVFAQLADDDRLTQSALSDRGPGDEWHAVFNGPKGRVILVAQPQISDHPESCDILAPTDLVSVSSPLQPDVVVAGEDKSLGTWDIDVYDAKKRTQAMTPGDVAEAASKYVWGIRHAQGGELAVRAVTVVTTIQAGPMFRSDSRIDSLCAMPSDPGTTDLGDLVCARLDL